MAPSLWCSAEQLGWTHAQQLHTCQMNLYCEMKHLAHMESGYLIFSQLDIKLHLQNVILYLGPNLCPPNRVHFGTFGGICFLLMHIWLFKIILKLRSFVHCAMTPDKSNCGEGTRQIKGCTKTSFMSALLNDNGHSDGSVTTRFHHYDWF